MSDFHNITSWLPIDRESDFSIHNLPFGIFSHQGGLPKAGVAIGDKVIDLEAVASLALFKGLHFDVSVFRKDKLNDFIALGKPAWQAVRQQLTAMLCDGSKGLEEYAEKALIPMGSITMHMPVDVGDYTDFYVSEEHATNVGKLFRDPENALQPNWKHMPIAYHGRASSILVSGIDFHRPKGQYIPADSDLPVYGPTQALDFELEVGLIIGRGTEPGTSMDIGNADDCVFGFVLFNDWSARDMQAWEYVPLGPFLGKNFASSISPWIVTMDALEPFRTSSRQQEGEVLPYLQGDGRHHFDIRLQAYLKPGDGDEILLTNTNYHHLYWSYAQQIAHHTVNGCNLNVGDILASGTISGKEHNSLGCLLEITRGGKQPLILGDGLQRTYLEDGDSVILRGYAEKNDIRVGFGEVRATVLPAK